MAIQKPTKPAAPKKAKESVSKNAQVVEAETPVEPKKAAPSKVKAPSLKVKEPLTAKKGMIIIKQIGSPIRRDPRQVLYLKSLGLGKINRIRQVVDNPSTRGLLDKLQHMVVVTEQ